MDDQEIRQQMIFDASQTLETLTKLEQCFTSLGRQLTDTATHIEQFNQRADEIVGSLRRMREEAASTYSQMSKLGSVRVAGGAAGGAGGGGGGGGGGAASPAMPAAPSRNYMLSWETFARIMQTQVLIRSLNATRDAFTEAYEANIKFSKQVSEIHAIDASRNFAQVAANVRQLSDAFNQPLTEVAEAQYQTISNQFVTAAEHANILTAANQLAKVSTQDLGSAAALVTGSLNAYGESSDMAGLRAAQFDQTIALGHLRMNDLATALGRTQTIAHELGVSVEELDASLISLSIGGVKANEAGTQIRGIMSALLKPSENLKTAFHELGVESGEQAISTWGLIGTLGKLNDVTHGSASEMAMLFPNVRGLAGALRIAGEGAEKYNEAMEKLRAVDQSTLQKKYEEFTSTDAEKVTKELNKLKNFYATEFGADIVASMKRVLGGMDSFIAVLRTVTGDLPSLAAAVGTVSAAWLLFGRSATLAATDAEVAGAPVAATTGRVQAAGEAAQVAAGRFSGFKGVLATIGLYEAAKAGGAAIGSWVENRITSEQEGIRAAYEQEARDAEGPDGCQRPRGGAEEQGTSARAAAVRRRGQQGLPEAHRGHQNSLEGRGASHQARSRPHHAEPAEDDPGVVVDLCGCVQEGIRGYPALDRRYPERTQRPGVQS